jgi:hypothetical protein
MPSNTRSGSVYADRAPRSPREVVASGPTAAIPKAKTRMSANGLTRTPSIPPHSVISARNSLKSIFTPKARQ